VYLEDCNPKSESTNGTSGSSVFLYRFDRNGLVRVAPVLNLATDSIEEKDMTRALFRIRYVRKGWEVFCE